MPKFYNLDRDFPGNDYPADIVARHLEVGDYLYMMAWGKPILFRKCRSEDKKSRVPFPQWHNEVEMVTDLDVLPEKDKAEVVLWLMEQKKHV